MKHLHIVFIMAFLSILTVTAQEKKIKFSSGTLKICSSKNFIIEGYDGKEVIIKSLHDAAKMRFTNANTNSNRNTFSYTTGDAKGKVSGTAPKGTYTIARGKSNNLFFSRTDSNMKKGLKRLGKKQENKELGIYFTIEQKNGELIFKDSEGQVVMWGNEKYSIKIPNSLKLNWDTNGCRKTKGTAPFVLYTSHRSSLSNFNGEVEISTSLNNFSLTDVTGPVSINSIGGNVTIDFDKKRPLKLYSVYTNNGFIDITMPSTSNVNVDAKGAAIYSDLDFKVISENESEGKQQMKLKLRKGSVKLKLEAGLGSIYLRKKKS